MPMIPTLLILSMLALLGSVFLIFFRRHRRKLLWLVPSLCLSIGVLAYANAVNSAREAGVTLDEWNAQHRARREADAIKSAELNAARDRAREQEAANREAWCLRDLTCVGDRFNGQASRACSPQIEARALTDYRWTATLTRYSRYGWQHPGADVIIFEGDAIEMQNRLGNWLRHTYQCAYNTATGTVERVHVRPGRL